MLIIALCMSQPDFLFGREPVLPTDKTKQSKAAQTHADYTERWKISMREAYEVAMKNIKKAAAKGQRNYNWKAWSSVLEPGDHVHQEPVRKRWPRETARLLAKANVCSEGKEGSGWPCVYNRASGWNWKLKCCAGIFFCPALS